jgi:16S rRNA (guanine527-N7)-methyltransferase
MMFHVKHEGSPPIDELSPAQLELLSRYERLLETRGASLGLISTADLPRLHERHVLDGLRGVACLPPNCSAVADLGSGGGIPGVPVAIARPDLEVVLAEVRRSRAAFLELVADELGLGNVRVHLGRAESLDRRFQACLARAFAPPEEGWLVAAELLVDGGVLVYWAGERFDPARDAPADVQVRFLRTDPLAYGGPVVIMGPR